MNSGATVSISVYSFFEEKGQAEKICLGVHSSSQFTLAKMFKRAQEYYENPALAGIIVTEETIDQWFKNNINPEKPYEALWDGFNIPAESILAWIEGVKSTNMAFSSDEEILLEVIKKYTNGGDFRYIIGTTGDKSSKSAMLGIGHEMAHFLYSASPSFRSHMDQETSYLPAKLHEEMEKNMEELGYKKDKYRDEMQAFLNTGLTREMKQAFLSQGCPLSPKPKIIFRKSLTGLDFISLDWERSSDAISEGSKDQSEWAFLTRMTSIFLSYMDRIQSKEAL
jgi:hypothetical protein